jgi:hypothetical protein
VKPSLKKTYTRAWVNPSLKKHIQELEWIPAWKNICKSLSESQLEKTYTRAWVNHSLKKHIQELEWITAWKKHIQELEWITAWKKHIQELEWIAAWTNIYKSLSESQLEKNIYKSLSESQLYGLVKVSSKSVAFNLVNTNCTHCFLTMEYILLKIKVSDCCLTPTQQFFSYIMARTS